MARHARLATLLMLIPMLFVLPARAAERELDGDTAPDSTDKIQNPIGRVFRAPVKKKPLFLWAREQLADLPPFFADSVFEARYRTYYFRTDTLDDTVNEAWAMGGSLYYRSGWLRDVFSVEVEGFTSQKISAEKSNPGTSRSAFRSPATIGWARSRSARVATSKSNSDYPAPPPRVWRALHCRARRRLGPSS